MKIIKTLLLKLSIIIGLLLALQSLVFAKISAPTEIEAVIYNNIKIVAPSEKAGYIQGIDQENNKLVWEKQLYEIEYDTGMETGVQEIFITNIDLNNSNLTVTNQKGDIFTVNLEEVFTGTEGKKIPRKPLTLVDESKTQAKLQSQINVIIYLMVGAVIAIFGVIRYYRDKKSKDQINNMLKFIKKKPNKPKSKGKE